jgi:hypothetical protein
MLDLEYYSQDWEIKKVWYVANFPGQLITTQESATLSQETKLKIASCFGVEGVG